MPKRSRTHAAIGILLLLSIARVVHAAPTAAQRQESRKNFDHGVTEFKLGHFAEAAEAYEVAYRVLPDPVLLFNAAQAHRLAGHKERALSLYKSYLRDYGTRGGNAPEVEANITTLTHSIEADRAKAAEDARIQRETAERELSERIAAQQAATEASKAETARLHLAAAVTRPIYKRGWFWGVVGGSVVAVGLGIGLGVGLGVHKSDPAPSYGAIQAN